MSRLTAVSSILVVAAAAAALVDTAVEAKIVDGLRAGFYNKTCPEAEATIRDVVNSEIGMDRTIAAGILRIFFHDCFITTRKTVQLFAGDDALWQQKFAQAMQKLGALDVLVGKRQGQIRKQCRLVNTQRRQWTPSRRPRRPRFGLGRFIPGFRGFF
ncbi:hypothetical protein ABZP36_012097 [Zizania latifolia]